MTTGIDRRRERPAFHLCIAVFLLAVPALLVILACGEESAKAPTATETPVQQQQNTDGQAEPDNEQLETVTPEATAGAAQDGGEPTAQPTTQPTSSPGSGTVTIGDDTHAFTVDYCELAADATEIDIGGQGLAPDGRPFTVRATRNGKIDTIQVRFDEGLTVYTTATGTSDALGGQPPSFQVDGGRVTTTATFYTTEELEQGPDATGAEGSFVVDCP
jgi:hypothetical protein